jgi:hypothetical protein
MKKLTYIALLFSTLAFSQTKIKRYEVNCANNTVVRDTIIVKELVFISEMLPMSYNSQLTIYQVTGRGIIVSPSTVTTRRPKPGEHEPRVIIMGCASEFQNLRIGKFVNVEYRCYE